MRRIPEDDGNSLDELPDTLESLAFDKFCKELVGTVNNYVKTSATADATLRAQRVVNTLTQLVEDMNNQIRQTVQFN